MDEIIKFLKSNSEIDNSKLKEIRELLINMPMYEWYINTLGDEPLEDYFKILELLGKMYYLEELVSAKCSHIFFFNTDENKYQCIRCGCCKKRKYVIKIYC